MQAADRPALMPSDGVLALHDLRQSYGSSADFRPQLAAREPLGLRQGDQLSSEQDVATLQGLEGTLS